MIPAFICNSRTCVPVSQNALLLIVSHKELQRPCGTANKGFQLCISAAPQFPLAYIRQWGQILCGLREVMDWDSGGDWIGEGAYW